MGGPARVDGKACRSTDNFLVQPMTILGMVDGVEQPLTWSTCEHFFQAVKFDTVRGGPATQQYVRAIQESESAGSAWSMGQSRAHPIRGDWEAVKTHAMYIGVKAKYDQYPELAAELASTEGPISAANSTSNWQQLNSAILERVREEVCRAAGKPRASQAEFASWVRLTDMPSGADPLVIQLTTTGDPYKLQTAAAFMQGTE